MRGEAAVCLRSWVNGLTMLWEGLGPWNTREVLDEENVKRVLDEAHMAHQLGTTVKEKIFESQVQVRFRPKGTTVWKSAYDTKKEPLEKVWNKNRAVCSFHTYSDVSFILFHTVVPFGLNLLLDFRTCSPLATIVFESRRLAS